MTNDNSSGRTKSGMISAWDLRAQIMAEQALRTSPSLTSAVLSCTLEDMRKIRPPLSAPKAVWAKAFLRFERLAERARVEMDRYYDSLRPVCDDCGAKITPHEIAEYRAEAGTADMPRCCERCARND